MLGKTNQVFFKKPAVKTGINTSEQVLPLQSRWINSTVNMNGLLDVKVAEVFCYQFK